MKSNNTIVLFRHNPYLKDEYKTATKYFKTTHNRTACYDSLVIGRYSVLPYYLELQKDLEINNCKLINSYNEHLWIANFDYYKELKDFTPETWFDHDFPYVFDDGPFVVKGRTSSLKFQWDSRVFAKDKKRAIEIGLDLKKHKAIGEQGIVYRRYVPLKTFELSYNGLPITNEYRFFFYKQKMLAYGYYWEQWCSDLSKPSINDEGIQLAQECANIASEHVNFFSLDVAEKEKGGWILIEVNDAQQSGLSLVDDNVLYQNLGACLSV